MIKDILLGGARIESASAHIGLTILRVYTGLSMAFAHGLGKMPPSDGFIEGTGAMGFPLPAVFAWLAGLSEFGGGLLLALGLMTRPAAFFMGSTMFVAAFIRHGDDPFSSQEKALLFFFIAVTFIFVGAGKYGVDAWIRARGRNSY